MPASADPSEQPLGAAFDFAAIGMAVLTPDSRVRRANPAFCEMLGYTPQQLRDLPPHALAHPDDWQDEVVQRGRLLAGAASRYQCEQRYLHSDGHVLWGQLTCELVRDAAGRALHFICQVQDITRLRDCRGRGAGRRGAVAHAPATPARTIRTAGPGARRHRDAGHGPHHSLLEHGRAAHVRLPARRGAWAELSTP